MELNMSFNKAHSAVIVQAVMFTDMQRAAQLKNDDATTVFSLKRAHMHYYNTGPAPAETRKNTYLLQYSIRNELML